MSGETRKLPWAGYRGRRAEDATIVRELAEQGPFIEQVWPDDERCASCHELSKTPDFLADPANHEPTCLWRRAKGLYPGDHPARP
jgi:hypothetical protein